MKTLELILQQEDEEYPIERVLRKKLGLTKKQISGAKFRENGITVNGMKQRISYRGTEGEILRVCIEEGREDTGKVVPVRKNLEILYEDRDLIVVNKPPQMSTHPGRGHYEDTLANRLAGYYEEKGEKTLLRAVGRLDRDTSGIVVFAKNRAAAARLNRERDDRAFQKEYEAVISGKPNREKDSIFAPIGNDPEKLGKMKATATGKSARTDYEILRSTPEYSLVRCRIYTGRTHQIRVHMAWLGHSILGDPLYGTAENPLFPGLALHCKKAVFVQPFSGERIEVSAEAHHWNF